MSIPFNIPPCIGTEITALQKVIENRKICGDGEFTKLCNRWMEGQTNVKKALLATSGTHALEMAALLVDIQAGDEVIMPSYTFTSTANAFLLRKAKIVFVDIRPDTMNIDERLIEQAITSKTKAIVPVHYAGVSCEMDTIMGIANKHNLFVIEDAAQAVMSSYKGSPLGSIGHFGCFSFHETKNYSCGEGGALLVRDEQYVERAEIIREKGTNRAKFFRGQVDKYTWQDAGSSYLPSELNAAYLYPQLEAAQQINKNRLSSWNRYYNGLEHLLNKIELPFIPTNCTHNAHMFYIKTENIEVRTKLTEFLKNREIHAVFHYIPLHSSPAGLKYGKFFGEDRFTTKESERILRLPMYYNLSQQAIDAVVNSVSQFFGG